MYPLYCMKNNSSVNLSLASTKVRGLTKRFDLNDPSSRQKYFAAKAGKDVQKLQRYLKSGKTFVAFLVGKKNSGKGTYSKLFMEAVGRDHVGHLAVGDIVRDVHTSLKSPAGRKKLIGFLKKNYRGYHSPEETIDVILGRSQSTLITSELVLALIKFELSKRPRQALFIDGFPRAFDQISYSLFLKEIIGYREDPDFFVFLDVPTNIIDERIKTRVVCPICKTPRNLRLLATKEVGYDEKGKKFYLKCDNAACKGARMVAKEGDEFGIEPIRERLETDNKISKQLRTIHGIPKIFLRNAIPAARAKRVVDNYEITPGYHYELDPKTKKVKTIETPWIVKDDSGVPSYSLLPAAVVVSLLKQMSKILTG